MCVMTKGKTHAAPNNVFFYNVCVLSITQLLRVSALLSCHLKGADIFFFNLLTYLLTYLLHGAESFLRS